MGLKTIWFISDTHFFHANMLTFTDELGQLVRPGFTSFEDMNERMVDNWNSVVKDGDHVWHLGDVAMGFSSGHHNTLLRRLKGKKRLVVGNHDKLKSEALHMNFEKIELWRGFKDEGFVCSHIPLRTENFRGGVKVNVHGHIHERVIDDPQYINVCVEQINYTPISMEEITDRVKDSRI